MDDESKKLLKDTYKLAQENHKMLRKVRSVQNRQVLFQIVRWVIIIGIAAGALYFLQPYIDQFQSFVKETGLTIQKIKGLMPN